MVLYYKYVLSLSVIRYTRLSPLVSHFSAALGSAQTAESLTVMPIIWLFHCWIHDTYPATAHSTNTCTHNYKCACNTK